jgi:hypothetical protein
VPEEESGGVMAKKKPKPKPKPKPKKKIPNPVAKPVPNPAAAPGPTAEPFTGTITPATAGGAGGDTGTSEAPGGGDLTGTTAIAAEGGSVFGEGSGFVPQYNYGLQPMQPPTAAAMSETAEAQ